MAAACLVTGEWTTIRRSRTLTVIILVTAVVIAIAHFATTAGSGEKPGTDPNSGPFGGLPADAPPVDGPPADSPPVDAPPADAPPADAPPADSPADAPSDPPFDPGPEPVTPRTAPEVLYASQTFYEDYEAYMRELVSKYQGLGIVDVKVLGSSVEGREIHDVVIGEDGAGAHITINATHHPGEYINTMLVLDQMEHIMRLWDEDGEWDGIGVKELLKKVQIHFVPLVNPDGLEALKRAIAEGSPVKTAGCDLTVVNANNVNLNRNYDACFKPNVQQSGDCPFSEPESCALRDLHAAIDFDYSVAYHSVGNVIFWNYGQTGEFYDRTLELAKLIASRTGYALDMEAAAASAYIQGTADFGGYKDWLVTEGHAAVTIETGASGILRGGVVPWSAYPDILRRNLDLPLVLAARFYRDKDLATPATTPD